MARSSGNSPHVPREVGPACRAGPLVWKVMGYHESLHATGPARQAGPTCDAAHKKITPSPREDRAALGDQGPLQRTGKAACPTRHFNPVGGLDRASPEVRASSSAPRPECTLMVTRSQALPGNALPARLCLACEAGRITFPRRPRREAEPRWQSRSQAEPGNETLTSSPWAAWTELPQKCGPVPRARPSALMVVSMFSDNAGLLTYDRCMSRRLEISLASTSPLLPARCRAASSISRLPV